MNKKLLILLCLVAIPLYVWDLWQMFGSRSGGTEQPEIVKTQTLSKLLTKASREVRFTALGKSPLAAFAGASKPVASVGSAKAASVSTKALTPSKPQAEKPAEVVAPRIAITGIMWNPTNPVAMVTLPDGSSSVVKAGMVIGDITIVKVEKNQIQIKFQGKPFTIGR